MRQVRVLRPEPNSPRIVGVKKIQNPAPTIGAIVSLSSSTGSKERRSIFFYFEIYMAEKITDIIVENIVMAIVENITYRKGIGQVFEAIDDDTRNEILQDWSALIKKHVILAENAAINYYASEIDWYPQA